MFNDLFQEDGLSLERLHALILLEDNGSLIRAANGDSGRQSRLSHYIKELSGFFGVELTERVGKTIRLSQAGMELTVMIRRHLSDITRFKRNVSNLPPTFRFGAGESLLQWLVIPSLPQMQSTPEQIHFILSNLRTQEINARLQDQRLDVGLLREDAVAVGLKRKPACSIKYVVVVPQRIVGRRRQLSLKEALLNYPHAALAGDGAMRASLDRIAGDFGGLYVPQLQCDSIAQCVAAVKTTHFAAVLPSWAWQPEAGIEHLVCEDPGLAQLRRSLVLAWHPRLVETHGEKVKELVDGMANTFRQKCK
ncbi:MAG: LysR family transcriptional regulator [Verrucomicrobiota bacterium]